MHSAFSSGERRRWRSCIISVPRAEYQQGARRTTWCTEREVAGRVASVTQTRRKKRRCWASLLARADWIWRKWKCARSKRAWKITQMAKTSPAKGNRRASSATKKYKGNRLLCQLIAFSIGQLVAQFLEFNHQFSHTRQRKRRTHIKMIYLLYALLAQSQKVNTKFATRAVCTLADWQFSIERRRDSICCDAGFWCLT